MKVLWATNTIFPQLSRALGKDAPVVGGWMYGLAADLQDQGVALTIVTARPGMGPFHHSLEGAEYYLLKGRKPITEYDPSLEDQWKRIIAEVQPDIVHIHGTEYAHGLALMKAEPGLKYVISIQGMTSVISRYYTAGISTGTILANTTFRDIVKGDGILAAKRNFKIRGERIEKTYIELARDIIGRTTWDHDHVKTLNPQVNYHFCDESLRDSFYTSKKWALDSKNDHTLFLSQAAYPIKGLHKVIEAVALLKSDYPNIQVRIAGNDILRGNGGFLEGLKRKGYGKYIASLLRRHDLSGHVKFVGYRNEDQMVAEYAGCHAFVSPSSIENGSNSIGEAQILGAPCIASYVGGVPTTITHQENGLLYRFEETEMLAQSIRRVFENDSLARHLSNNGIKTASVRHDRQRNTDQMISIYEEIVQGHTSK